MKKAYFIFITLILLIALSFTACNKSKSNNSAKQSDTTSGQQSEAPDSDNSKIPENAVLLSTEKGCRVLYADGHRDLAIKIYDKLYDLDTDAYSKIGYYEVLKADKTAPADEKIEVLIGMTDREQSRNAKDNISTYLDYTVQIIDGKIVINANTTEGLRLATDYFTSHIKCLGENVFYTPDEIKYIYKHTDYSVPNLTISDIPLSDFVLVYPENAADWESELISQTIELIGINTGAIINAHDDTNAEEPNEILIGKTNRAESDAVYADISPANYIFGISKSGNSVKVVMAYENTITMSALIEDLTGRVAKSKKVPEDFSGEVREDLMIVSKIESLRDPCVLLENGTYYIYGTGWVGYKNTSGKLDGEWIRINNLVNIPAEATKDLWAPEVHKYNGKFYMFATYFSSVTNHRGCTVLRADSPEGPFEEISEGPLTPSDWDAIDATPYIDEEGQPWMVFVHEWTSTDDGIGRMAAAKLSDDFTHLTTEPIELFRADDPSWTDHCVTDGCWLYRCSTGELLMIWSNFYPDGYCVGIARSDNGKIDGNWTQDDNLLYSKKLSGQYDGGHGMIFRSVSGKLYLSIHSPNKAQNGYKERPVFIAIREENGTLVWDK